MLAQIKHLVIGWWKSSRTDSCNLQLLLFCDHKKFASSGATNCYNLGTRTQGRDPRCPVLNSTFQKTTYSVSRRADKLARVQIKLQPGLIICKCVKM